MLNPSEGALREVQMAVEERSSAAPGRREAEAEVLNSVTFPHLLRLLPRHR